MGYPLSGFTRQELDDTDATGPEIKLDELVLAPLKCETVPSISRASNLYVSTLKDHFINEARTEHSYAGITHARR